MPEIFLWHIVCAHFSYILYFRTFRNSGSMIPQTNIAWTIVTAIAIILSCRSWIQIDQNHILPENRHPYSTHSPFSPKAVFDSNQLQTKAKCSNWHVVRDLIGKPEAILSSGVKGEVIFNILLDEKGYYLSHKIIGYPHPLLQAYSEPYIPFLRFSPGKNRNQAVHCWKKVVFEF